MTDVYKRLATRLDELPSGYPATESGVELKILQHIFTPEEAEMTLKMRSMPETVETVAERLGKSVPEMQAVLDSLVQKGQIGSFKMFGQRMYMLFPFLVGIYEFQLNRMDKELAELFEAYAPALIRTLGGFEPALGRVIPVSTQIDAELRVHRYEDVRRIINEAKSFQLMDCICRKERALQGSPCTHTLETCLGISQEEGAFDRFPRGKIISREEALKVITRAEEEGLVHFSYNVPAAVEACGASRSSMRRKWWRRVTSWPPLTSTAARSVVCAPPSGARWMRSSKRTGRIG
jgi:H+/Na+-translocating ferredoxin:NAD+ oxidoreductase subunit B